MAQDSIAQDAGEAARFPVALRQGSLFRRHYPLIVLTLAYTSSHVDRGIVNILMQPIKNEFHVSDTLLGLMSGLAFAVFYATLGVPIAMWADRGNRRNIIALAVTIWSAMTAACGLAGEFRASARRAHRRRHRRGGIEPALAFDDLRPLPEGAALDGDGLLFRRRLCRRDDRPRARRLGRSQLRLARHVLRRRSAGPADRAARALHDGRAHARSCRRARA